jgi:hypothetical protein
MATIVASLTGALQRWHRAAVPLLDVQQPALEARRHRFRAVGDFELQENSGDVLWLLGICFLWEAPERANGSDRRAGKWGLVSNEARSSYCLIVMIIVGFEKRTLRPIRFPSEA